MEIIVGKSKTTGNPAAYGTHSDAVQVGSGSSRETLTQALDKKQGTIIDLDEIRSNAQAGVAHAGNGDVHVTTSQKTTWNDKYSKPSGGIPQSDLSSAVQALLNKAGSSLQPGDLGTLNSKVSALESLMSEGTNPTKAIDKFNEIVAFLSGFENTETLSQLQKQIVSYLEDEFEAADARLSGEIATKLSASAVVDLSKMGSLTFDIKNSKVFVYANEPTVCRSLTETVGGQVFGVLLFAPASGWTGHPDGVVVCKQVDPTSDTYSRTGTFTYWNNLPTEYKAVWKVDNEMMKTPFLPLSGGTMSGDISLKGTRCIAFDDSNGNTTGSIDSGMHIEGKTNITLTPNAYNRGPGDLDVSIKPSEVRIGNKSGEDWTTIKPGGIKVEGCPNNDEDVTYVEADWQGVKATKFVKYGGTSAQFLKADGSVDETTYARVIDVDKVDSFSQDDLETALFVVDGSPARIRHSVEPYQHGGSGISSDCFYFSGMWAHENVSLTVPDRMYRFVQKDGYYHPFPGNKVISWSDATAAQKALWKISDEMMAKSYAEQHSTVTDIRSVTFA